MALLRNYSFAGGMQRRTSKFLVKDEEVYLSQNFNFECIGAAEKRKGYEQLGADIGTDSDVLGLYSFAMVSTGDIYFLAVSGTDAYVYNTTTKLWTAQSQTLTAGAKADMAAFVDYAYLVNGKDAPRSFDGADWSTAVNVTNAPTASYVRAYRNRLYMARTATKTSTLYWSSEPTGAAITWDTTKDWMEIYPDDGTGIRGLTVNGDRLLIFKDHSLHTWDLFNLTTLSHTVGTLSNRSIATSGNYTLFLDRRGVYVTQGDRPILVSEDVYDYIENLTTTQLQNATGSIIGDCYYLYLGVTNGLTYCMLKFNLIQNTWTVYELADTFKMLAPHEDTGGLVNLYGGTDDGEIMKLWTGNEDDGGAVSATLITRWFYPSAPERFNNIVEVIVFSDKADSVAVYYQTSEDVDWSESIGTLNDEYTKLNLAARGRGIRFKFVDSATDERCIIYGFTVRYEPEEVL